MSRMGAYLSVAVALAACDGGPTMTAGHRQALADSGRQVVRDFAAAMNSGDIRTALRFFADEPSFHWAENGRIAYPSYQAVATVYDSLQGALRRLSLTMDDPRIVPLAPGLVFGSSTYRERMTDTAGTVLQFAGVFSFVAEHADSGWTFVGGHGSTARDLPAQPASPPRPRR